MQAPESNSVLEYTESLCPICLKVIEARTIVQDNAVYLKKICPDHGPCTTYLWPEVKHFCWMNNFRLPFKKPKFEMPMSKGCLSDCGLCSIHLRQSTLIEVEVTQSCNLRCPVCFMSAGEAPLDPSLETLQAMFEKILSQTGPQTSVQLTGGEPTARQELAEIVKLGSSVGFSAIEVNTNGLVIGRNPDYIHELARAGISGIYLQFDGLTGAVYEKTRGADLLKDKLQAVENCRAAGVQVVLAMTVVWGVNHNQLGTVLNYALQNRDVIAGVALQPAFISGRFDVETARRLTMGDVVFMLSEQSGGLITPYDLWPLGCSHPLCSCATYLVEEAGEVKPFTRLITPQEYMREFGADSPQGSVFADIAARRLPELRPGLSIVIMNYMDAMSVDLKRLKECSMTVTMEDGRLIPFCAYQMTDIYGNRLYPVWGRDGRRLLTERAYV